MDPPATATDSTRTPRPLGRMVSGLVLIAIGIVWLLDVVGVVTVSLLAVVAVALIGVGLALLVGSRTGSHGGLVALGVMLTLLLATTSTARATLAIPIGAGVGDRTERPATLEELRPGYELAVGSLTVDLREIEFGRGRTPIRINLGVGELAVIVPPDVTVVVDYQVALGQAQVFGREASGSVPRSTVREEGRLPSGPDLRISVGIGQLQVRR